MSERNGQADLLSMHWVSRLTPATVKFSHPSCPLAAVLRAGCMQGHFYRCPNQCCWTRPAGFEGTSSAQ